VLILIIWLPQDTKLSIAIKKELLTQNKSNVGVGRYSRTHVPGRWGLKIPLPQKLFL
jgi:hypothetical protein